MYEGVKISLASFLALCGAAFGFAPDGAPSSPAPSPGERDHKSWASTLNQIVWASRERFRPLQGARIQIRPGRTYWFEARVNLPGAGECRVLEHPTATYSCEWEKTAGADLMSLYRRLAAEIEAALGPKWDRAPESASPRKIIFKEPLKESATSNPLLIEVTAAEGGSESAVRVVCHR
jgi:hypothetical protein